MPRNRKPGNHAQRIALKRGIDPLSSRYLCTYMHNLQIREHGIYAQPTVPKKTPTFSAVSDGSVSCVFFHIKSQAIFSFSIKFITFYTKTERCPLSCVLWFGTVPCVIYFLFLCHCAVGDAGKKIKEKTNCQQKGGKPFHSILSFYYVVLIFYNGTTRSVK